MLDLLVVRREPDRVRRSMQRRGIDPSIVDEILRLDAEYRSALTESERAAAERNRLSTEIAKASDKASAARERRGELERIASHMTHAAEAARALSPQSIDSPLGALLSQAPNLIDEGVPDGYDDASNVEVRRGGTQRTFDFEPLPHDELGSRLGILDLLRAAKLSGSRFSILMGAGARLARALQTFFLDRAGANGYVEVAPPLLVSRETMWSTGQLSKFSDAMFSDAEADLFLIPTAEVPLTALHGNEILRYEQLPLKYAAYTPCFRKEAGAAGKDTRGIVRQHQFEKVELVRLCTPEESPAQLDELTRDAEGLLQLLELPYHVVALCAGDLGFSVAKTYDLEVWFPGAKTFREISSCSSCTDFQSRRAQIRFRRESGGKPEFVHTLNGSGLPIGRTLAAILENYQRADGSVDVPTVLQPYLGASVIR